MRILAKLGFIHRRLWRDDLLYRACLLLGPAPLQGAAIAAAAWLAVEAFRTVAPAAVPPSWATPRSDVWSASDSQPHFVSPTLPLPQAAPHGELAGYSEGWQVTINPVVQTPDADVDVKPTPLSGFTIEGGSIDMAQLVAEGPKDTPFVGVGAALLVARTAGVYVLTARLERSAGRSVDCLSRMGFGQHRLFSNFDINIVNDIFKVFEPVRFELQPGLYRVGWAFGCWEGQQDRPTGRFTMLVGHPGELQPQPARSGDFVRPATAHH
jgi:hypothetical protein